MKSYTFSKFCVCRIDKERGLFTELFIGPREHCFSWRAKEELMGKDRLKIYEIKFRVTKEAGYHDSNEIARTEVFI